MIIAGYEFRKEKPFENVYFTGMVRDSLRRKMSKSLGNSPDPLELIEKYGADGVRVGMLLCSPAGNDLLFDESLTEQGRNFCNKLWNTFRLIRGWTVDVSEAQPEAAEKAIHWFEAKLNQTLELVDDQFSKFRISGALMAVYTLIKDEFSGWYLEAIKPAYQRPIDQSTYKQTLLFLDKLLKLLHPFMPFISEEIYQLIVDRPEGESIMISEMPKAVSYDKKLIREFEKTKEIIASIRNIRQGKNLQVKETVDLAVVAEEKSYNKTNLTIVQKLANVKEITFVAKPDEGAVTFMVMVTQYSVSLGTMIDVEAEKKKLEEELKYQQGFLNSVMRKLGNKNFVKNAPEKVVTIEQKKKTDAENKIKTLTDRLKSLS
ncbi:Valine--tRNA ligase [subsurface metagenome]